MRRGPCSGVLLVERLEVDAYVRLLHAVARVDGRIERLEALALAVVSGEDRLLANDDIDMAREVSQIRSPKARKLTFEAAVAIAIVDGRPSPEEHDLLQHLHVALRVNELFDLAVVRAEWTERLEASRVSLTAAEVDFLHQILHATRDGALSSPRYVALVTELRSRHTNILREALGPVLPN